MANIRQECGKIRDRLEESKRDVLSRRSANEQSQLLNILDAMISVRQEKQKFEKKEISFQSKSIDVHLSLLKKKVQSENEKLKKSEEKLLVKVHQQINDKRNDLNRIDQQLNYLIQENPIEKLDQIEVKIRDLIRLFAEIPSRIQSLNLIHLTISNELRAKIFNWTNEEISRIELFPTNSTNEIHFDSSTTYSRSNSFVPNRSERSSTTPLTSLKQLLGIRTQDSTQIETIVNHQEVFTKDEIQK